LEEANPILHGLQGAPEVATNHISYLEESALKRTHGENTFSFHAPIPPIESIGLRASCVHPNCPIASPVPSARTITSRHALNKFFMIHLHVLSEMNDQKAENNKI
jgi:hypothetical protein